MSKKGCAVTTPRADVPYDLRKKAAVLAFWDGATSHRSVAELRAKRGRSDAARAGRPG